MGLFDLFKPKQIISEKECVEKEALKSLARYYRENGDLNMAFYYDHKAIIDLYERQITDQLVLARNVDDAGNAIQYLQSALSTFDAMKKYCSNQPGGAEFYKQHVLIGPDKLSRVERLKKQIEDAKYIYHTVVPAILERSEQEGGAKQADLCREFDIGRERVLAEIRRLELNGSIRTEKHGNYVYLFRR